MASDQFHTLIHTIVASYVPVRLASQYQGCGTGTLTHRHLQVWKPDAVFSTILRCTSFVEMCTEVLGGIKSFANLRLLFEFVRRHYRVRPRSISTSFTFEEKKCIINQCARY